MARAKRHYIPGHVWHPTSLSKLRRTGITHRCHKKEFLLKFAKDRQRWMHWLFEAKKRYGLAVLNFMITSNHLIVAGDDSKDVISRSMQLVASRTAQEYNWRKNRKGAYWEDRYHATAIEQDDHLFRWRIKEITYWLDWRGFKQQRACPRKQMGTKCCRWQQKICWNDKEEARFPS